MSEVRSARPDSNLCVLREPGPGDLSHLIARHGALYSKDYGFDESFEALIAEIASKFARDHDPRCERLWIADLEGVFAGSVMIVREDETTARLRFFLVEPTARGRGIGTMLLEDCLRFSRAKGYHRVVLTTVDLLHSARSLYFRQGFYLIDKVPAQQWSQTMFQEEWQLDLLTSASATTL